MSNKFKNYIIKIIIYLFEKYAFDDWVELQDKLEKERIMKVNNLENEEQLLEYFRDRTQEPLREAYDAGCQDTYAKLSDRIFY